jgi:hypothetical protein
MKELMGSEEIVRGLKHYRRIAKQDLLRADESSHPEEVRRHAEARRAVYTELAECAERSAPEDVVAAALALYRELPFVSGSGDTQYPDIRGRENALENFFLMVGLDPKLRREARRERPPLDALAR